MVIGGSRRTLVWDDLNPQQRLSVYDRGVDLDRAVADRGGPQGRGRSPTGSATPGRPALPEHEALGAMVAEFAASIRRAAARRAPTARAGLRVLSVLEAAADSLGRRDGAPRRRSTGDAAAAGEHVDERRCRAPRSWSPAAPAPSGPPSSTSCSTPASPTSTSSTTWSAAARANLDDALATGRVTLVEGDLRDRDLVHDVTRGKDLVFHQAAIRITQCAEEPRLALEVLVDGTFNVLEAAAEHRVDKLVAASSAPRSTAWPRSSRPTERHHHHNNDTFYGAAKSFNEGMPRSFRAMNGLDYVAAALLQRLRPADGRPRPLHRGAGPLDGAHRRRPAAADLRRRPRRRWTSSTPPTSPGPTCSPRPATCVEGVYNVASGTETSLLELAEALLRAMDSDLHVEHGPDRAVNGVVRRLADTSAARARPRLHRRDRARGGPARARRAGGVRCARRSPRGRSADAVAGS